MTLYFEWIGSICGVLGALMISSNTRVSPWGWWMFLASSLSLCGYALLQQAWGLLMLNGFFVATNLIGLIRWWYPAVFTLQSNATAGGKE
ncbi:nicotinamide mononucleotide transporter [Pseudomonas sp. 2FE]|uniref:nicotinamide mononucleotide transporter n=1 Tax=Pseudomonas sp. 2FE TaxID=2502190 RepID=UPI0010F5C471|nr:nicotinamide mononucleotide transporter [Pseudomonas sp. 2FE]